MAKKIVMLIMAFLWVLNMNATAADRKEQNQRFSDRIKSIREKGVLPILDVEYHHGGKVELERLIEKMDENGVALTWLGPNEKLGSEESLRANKRFPDKFVPTTVHGDGPLWHKGDKGFLQELKQDVDSGKYFAMGEFEARHYRSNTNTRDVHMPVDSEAMQVVWQLSQATGIPFALHHEAEDPLLPEVERMLVKYPQAKLIWCHGGRNRNPSTWIKFREADGVRDLLQKYPNLYFDIVQSQPGSKYSPTCFVDAVIYQAPRYMTIDSAWKKLLETFPDRFLIGSDINTGRFANYHRTIGTFREILFRDVKKDVAEKIAFKNAWKLMTGEEWKE